MPLALYALAGVIGLMCLSASHSYARGTCTCSNREQPPAVIASFCTENRQDCEHDCHQINPELFVGYVENTGECPEEPHSPVVCSGEPRNSDRGVKKEVGQGRKAGERLCIEGDVGKSASKLYCSMYDDATNYIPCSWSTETNGTCRYMASVAMKLSTSSDNKKKYCWVFNAEDVKRKRYFFLDADWE